MLGATSTMPIHDGEINLDSTRLNKQLQNSQAREDNIQTSAAVHDHLKSASMLKGQFY